jgi:chemotaxis protein MotA
VLSLVGVIVVFVGVFGGYMLHGGDILIIWQPTEFIVMGGAAIGSVLIATPMPIVKEMIKQIGGAFKDSGHSKADYMELLLLLFELCRKYKTDLLSLEPHVEDPEKSDIFTKYPTVLKNHHAVGFMSDTLKVQISSPVPPYDLEDLMNADIGTAHEEEGKGPATVQTLGDAMPGIGIVAAVLGIIITMGKLSEGKEVIGQSVAAALVGTMLGVLAAYGFLSPLAGKMNSNIGQEGKYMEVVKQALLACAKNCSPQICVEFARRTIPPEVRPSFTEVDEATANIKKAA